MLIFNALLSFLNIFAKACANQRKQSRSVSRFFLVSRDIKLTAEYQLHHFAQHAVFSHTVARSYKNRMIHSGALIHFRVNSVERVPVLMISA